MRALVRLIAMALLATATAAPADEPKMDRKQREEAAVVNAQLGMEYMRQGDLVSARDKVEKALGQAPNQASVQMAAAFLYDRLGENEKAEAAFEHALKLGKGDPDVLNNFGAFLCRKGDKKRGESYFLEAARSPLYRTPAVAYANAGRCARADGRPQDAERYFRQALALKADQPDALYQLADLHHELGNELQARGFLQRYNAVAPASAASLWLGYRIERALGDTAQAADYAARLKKNFATSPEVGELLQAERAQR
jgi:type IV pilus assembly protein PilF